MTENTPKRTCWLRELSTGELLSTCIETPTPEEFTVLLRELDDAMPARNARLVWDLRALVGANPLIREQVIAFFNARRARIQSIEVVVPRSNAIVRTVTATVGLAIGIRVSFRNELDERSPPPA